MTEPSLDNTNRIQPWRAAVAWLAFVTLLGNLLLPGALSVGAGMLDGGSDTLGLKLCSASPGGDLPGKGKPGLPVHHCTCCPMPAPLPSRPRAGFVLVDEVVDGVHPQVRTTPSGNPLRHGRVQARAPPSAA